ncbi:unnamed protein product [Fusarium graminearum]|nr:unnamed protein product [Fusarium graminearum]
MFKWICCAVEVLAFRTSRLLRSHFMDESLDALETYLDQPRQTWTPTTIRQTPFPNTDLVAHV